jgi:DNA polymerase-3 subunit gamma/tau
MPQRLSGVATRMKNMTPEITEFPHVELVVENQLAMDQIEEIKGSVLSTLKTYLHNKSITFTVRVAEHHEQVRILTRREQYEQMVKENPSIGKLRDLLDLELA